MACPNDALVVTSDQRDEATVVTGRTRRPLHRASLINGEDDDAVLAVVEPRPKEHGRSTWRPPWWLAAGALAAVGIIGVNLLAHGAWSTRAPNVPSSIRIEEPTAARSSQTQSARQALPKFRRGHPLLPRRSFPSDAWSCRCRYKLHRTPLERSLPDPRPLRPRLARARRPRRRPPLLPAPASSRHRRRYRRRHRRRHRQRRRQRRRRRRPQTARTTAVRTTAARTTAVRTTAVRTDECPPISVRSPSRNGSSPFRISGAPSCCGPRRNCGQYRTGLHVRVP